ncbi:MAG: biotin/lipoyl-containing protein [Thermoplasmata archaeon]
MRFSFELDGKFYDVVVSKLPELTVTMEGEKLTPKVRKTKKGFQVKVAGRGFSIVREGDVLKVNGAPRRVSVWDVDFVSETGPPPVESEESREVPSRVAEEKRGAVHPPMPGRIVSVSVKKGAILRVGSPLLILEAMKMQNEVSSPLEGIVREIKVKPGDLVDVRDVLVVIEQA